MNDNKICYSEAEVLESIVEELNSKFDPENMFHYSFNGNKMFEGHYHTGGVLAEAWEIKFLGFNVFTGGSSGNGMNECQSEDYVTLESKNKRKIYMIAVSNTIKMIENLVTFFAHSNASYKNKNEWITIMKKGIEDEAV